MGEDHPFGIGLHVTSACSTAGAKTITAAAARYYGTVSAVMNREMGAVPDVGRVQMRTSAAIRILLSHILLEETGSGPPENLDDLVERVSNIVAGVAAGAASGLQLAAMQDAAPLFIDMFHDVFEQSTTAMALMGAKGQGNG